MNLVLKMSAHTNIINFVLPLLYKTEMFWRELQVVIYGIFVYFLKNILPLKVIFRTKHTSRVCPSSSTLWVEPWSERIKQHHPKWEDSSSYVGQVKHLCFCCNVSLLTSLLGFVNYSILCLSTEINEEKKKSHKDYSHNPPFISSAPLIDSILSLYIHKVILAVCCWSVIFHC